jgi:ParB/RepB/Spo0J family partition protein
MRTATRPVHEAGEEQVWIPIKKIEALKPDPKDRSYNKQIAMAMCEDIKVNGQLHPIHVRPHPDPRKKNGGCYQQITGLHRIEAQRMAGSDCVLCVVREADDNEFMAIRDAENAIRNNLTRDQTMRAIARLQAFYETSLAKQKTALEQRRDEIIARNQEAKEKPAQDNGSPAPADKVPRTSRTKPAGEAKKTRTGFNDLVASMLGVSNRTSRRFIKVSEMVASLTDDQTEILFPAGKATENILTKELEALVPLDPEARAKVINLKAGGMPWAQAIAQHTPKPKPAEPMVRQEEDYPHNEWIETFCARILPKLNNRAAFETESLKWREFRKIRKKAQNAVKELLESWRNRRKPGLYEKVIVQSWNVSHPNDWLPCGNCAAVGTVPIGSPKGEKCPACAGGGFQLKIERWE